MKSTINRLILSSVLFFSVIMISSAQDWPQWRGVNRDGKVTGFTIPQSWPEQFSQIWKVNVGSGDATPALVNNKLYVFSKQGEDEILQCFDARNGNLIWKTQGYPSAAITGPAASHPGPRSSVTVSDNKVITVGAWGDVACYDAATGTLLWRNEDYKGKVPQFNTGMSPLVEGMTCYTHLGGPQTGTFVAFDIATGRIKWKVDGECPAYGSPDLLTVDGVKQIVFQSLTKLIGMSLTDGKQLWEYATPAGEGRVQNATSPVVDQNKVYFTGLRNGFSAIEIRKNGTSFIVNKLWTNPEQSTDFSTPLLKDGFLYGINSQGRLFCINAVNGQTAWVDTTPLQRFGSLIDAGKEIVILTSNSTLMVINPDGQKFDQVALIRLAGNDYYAHPVLSGSNMILKDTGSITCYAIK
jgi:outer membrane protein assembly factor BamB